MPAEAVGAVRWYLEVDGITEGIFKEASGFDVEIEVIEHLGSSKGGVRTVHKVPGNVKWSNIVLRKGLSDDKKLWDWYKKIEDGGVEANRKNGTLTCYNPKNEAVAKYTFKKGWICKYKGPGVDASKNEIAMEEIEITHEGLERQQ
jgi:phage tail-like protein